MPRYFDATDSDVFVLTEAEDLVPVCVQDDQGQWIPEQLPDRTVNGTDYAVRRYQPRIEGLFARIERWTNLSDDSDTFWRCISRDNVCSWFGKTAESRIFDPANPRKIFSWLICESFDDKGNVVIYGYKEEDSTGINLDVAGNSIRRISEKNRTDQTRSAQRYIKRIRYGNCTPYYPLLKTDAAWPEPPDANAADGSNSWLFELVFDYGEHDAANPLPTEAGDWKARPDPYSGYRSGFEIRTYRKCLRVLMFHHFPGESGVGRNCLVRSTDFTYSDGVNPSDANNPIYSFLLKVGQTGYQRISSGIGYDSLSLPPVELRYSTATVQSKIKDVDPASLGNLPVGLSDSAAGRYQWVDLHGEGIPGILSEQGNAWHYKRNQSPLPQLQPDGSEAVHARFAEPELVALTPNVSLADGAQIVDLGGDGQPEVVMFNGPNPGYFPHDNQDGWSAFVPFESQVNCDWRDPNLRLVDLDGDGLIDLLITEDAAMVWHASLGRAGFGPSQRVAKTFDEETSARVIFADGTQTIFLADMSGDGLADLVRIRHSEICYWPNLGFGRFGAKVTMDNAPVLDTPDGFDPDRLRLADIDGSGTTDLIYLHAEGVLLAFNQSGNGWSQAQMLPIFPRVDELANISVCDLLGNGTACLVWSSMLPPDQQRPMRYVNLIGDRKPHLLIGSINNMGAETRIDYVPSTKFYLQDKQAGHPWITRLPFPVHVVERVTHLDHVSQHRFVTRFAYHHGYYDRPEREFRGFGMVEQWDTEAYEDYVKGVAHMVDGEELAPELYQPPTTTRTWFHTGAYLDQQPILHQLESEYFQASPVLSPPTFPNGLDATSLVQSVRALKGLQLRQEIYSFDGSVNQVVPYSITESSYELRQLQPCTTGTDGISLPVARESICLNLERNSSDFRASHTLLLEVDQYGNPVRSSSVVYGRRVADANLPIEVTADQQKTWITYSESDYTPDLEASTPADVHRLRTVCESRAYEITGISPSSTYFSVAEIDALIGSTTDIEYEDVANGTLKQKRLISQSRTLFIDNSLNPLPLGQWDTLALIYRNYRLAFTPNVVATQYAGQVSNTDLTSAGYVHLAADSNWWIPSGTAVYPANPSTAFYLPSGSIDPLGLQSSVTYDAYFLLPQTVGVVSTAWLVTSSVNDYRVLGPVQITDPNGNRVAVVQDALGMVVKTAIMGKLGGTDGDTLSDPTTRLEYNLFNWMNNGKPCFAHSFAREQSGAANPRWQESYVYSNGQGGVALTKSQAHAGPANVVQSDGTVIEVQADPRWIGNGKTIVNNKGNPVKQYEPYFSTGPDYDDEKALRQIGVTPVFYYDAIGRNIRTEFPNGTFTTVEFTVWMQKHYDANDTVKQSQWYADRGSPDPGTQPEPLADPEQRAAWLAAQHADTPRVTHSDALGRKIYAISDYGSGETSAVRSSADLTGRTTQFYDQAQRLAASSFVGMAGTLMFVESAEKGQRWSFPDVSGRLIKAWDEFGRVVSMGYDGLHRPVGCYVQESGQAKILSNFVVYGDLLDTATAKSLNLLGAPYLVFDQAGMMRIPSLDFRSRPHAVDRLLASDYKNAADWTSVSTQPDAASIESAANAFLDTTDVHSASADYDALNRPVQVTLPDGTVVVPTYDEANLPLSIKAQIRGQGSFVEYLKNQDYDAKGQRQFAQFGNGLTTHYLYDPQTFRLTDLVSFPTGGNASTQALQDLHYTYDPVGNVTDVGDDAQQTYYFNNAVVKPANSYTYDALYQLIQARGRESAGGVNDDVRSSVDLGAMQLPSPNSPDAVRNYIEQYEYDLLGNVKTFKHRYQSQMGAGSGWTRKYQYAFDLSPGDRTNRLVGTTMPGQADPNTYSGTYSYDNYGNMKAMPGLPTIAWNFMDQMMQVDLGGGGTAFYVYGSGGQRVRKVIERNGNLLLEWLFLGAVLIFRRRRLDTKALRFERSTVTISDNVGPIAQIDTKTRDDDNIEPANPLDAPLTRYRYSNLLGSATLETDDSGNPISYEEYHPFGTSAYRSSKSGADLSLKRYRFSGKELDDETGLYYFGARYYAPWLGRWVSSDPAGFVDGLNLFRYCRNNPATVVDPFGTDGLTISGKPPEIERAQKTHTEAAGQTYENWVRAQTITIDGHDYRIVGGTRQWFAAGHHWYIEAPDLEEVNPPQADAADSTGTTSTASGGAATSGTTSGSTAGSDAATSTPPATTSGSGTAPATSSSAQAGTGSSTDPNRTATAEIPEAGTRAAQELARPYSTTGARPEGTLHLWSGPGGKADAQAAIRTQGSGWMMGNIKGNPTPEHAAGEAEFAAARARAPGGMLPREEFESIWGPRSASVVGRGAFAGHPVEVHGTPAPTSIQVQYEWPARAVGGGLAGGLFFGSGMVTAISGGQDPNPGIAIPQVIAGVSEATSGIIYGSGAILGSAELMSIGSAGGMAFGGAGAAIGFGVASYRSFKEGDTTAGVVDALGAVGGILMIASLFTPVGWVGLLGIGLVAFAGGFNLGRWLSH